MLIAIGYPVQRNYFETASPSPTSSGSMSPTPGRTRRATSTSGWRARPPASWASASTAPTLSNDVDYLGREAPKGGFDAIPTCEEFRRAVNEAGLDYLVTAPFLNFIDPGRTITSPETRWLRGAGGLTVIRHDGAVRVWRVDGPLQERCGPQNRPLREVPDQPGI